MTGRKTVGIKEANRVLAAWVRAGTVTLPKRKMTPVVKSPARLPKGTAARLLADNRRDRGR